MQIINCYAPAKPTQNDLITTLIEQMTGTNIDKLLHHNDSVLITVTINEDNDDLLIYQSEYTVDDWFGNVQLTDNLQ